MRKRKEMNLKPECYPCMMKQALRTMRQLKLSEETETEILRWSGRHLASSDPSLSAPAVARHIYRHISEKTGVEDPYLDARNEANELALKMSEEILKEIDSSEDPLFTAVLVSIAGNIIDFAAEFSEFSIHDSLERVLRDGPAVNDYDEMKNDLANAKECLYLLDNSGEIAWDKIAVCEIKKRYPDLRVVAAVRGGPIINDVTYYDAKEVGMDSVCEITDSGIDLPGVHLELCKDDFQNTFKNADIIISKGQGNFETLHGSGYPIYYLFMVKCSAVAEIIGEKIGSPLLIKER